MPAKLCRAEQIDVHQYHLIHHDPIRPDMLRDLHVPRIEKVTSRPEHLTTEQAETAIAVAHKPDGTSNIVVVYNDRNDPNTSYPQGPSGPDRVITRGVSMLGYSTSRNDGQTFPIYGHVSPPAGEGYSAIFSDPAAATQPGSTDGEVFIAQMASSDAAWGVDDTIMNDGPLLDSWCVASPTDWV